MNKHQVAQRVGVERSLADQHLERLEAYDLIVLLPGARDDEEVLCFHPQHSYLWEPHDTRLLFGQAPLRQVALYVNENPGASTERIAEALESAPRTIQKHLATLRDLGLVDRHWFQDRVEYHSTDKLEAWAEDVGDCYRRPWTHGN